METKVIYLSQKQGTFKQVQIEVRKILKSGFEGNIEVHVAPGKYFFEDPIIFTPQDSGKGLITYKTDKTQEQDEVILSGAKTLSIKFWEDDKDRPFIKVAQLEKGLKIDGFIVNHKPQILCRYPNYIEGVVPLGSVTHALDIKKRIEGYKTVEGGYIRALHGYKWGGNSYKIKGKDEHNIMGLALEWVGDNNRGSHLDENAIVIENIFEELDAPCEWYYNAETGKLYFYPEKGLDLTHATCEATITSEIFKFIGDKDGDKVKNIVIDGFKIMDTKRTLFTTHEKGKAYIPLMRGDWCVVKSGAVYLQDAENIKLVNLTFDQIGGNAIFINGYNKNHIIENNSLTHIGATAIQVVGLPESVYEPSFWEHEHWSDLTVHKTSIDFKDKKGPKALHYPHHITISNNYIACVGIFEKQSSGINLSVSSECRILHNTIHNSPRSCININDGTFGGHEIAYNDIFESQKETTDHGPFNSWGRDRFWSVPHYNAGGFYGEQIKPYSLLDAVNTTIIHDNRFHHSPDQPHTWGIDLDDGSSNYEIYNNLCLGMGIKLREGFNRTVYNNIFIDGSINIHCTYAKAQDKVFRNIVVGSPSWEFAGQEGGDEKRVTEGEYEISSNIYYDEQNKVDLPKFFEKYGYNHNAVLNESPMFKNIQVNDYTVTNEKILEKTGFQNFDMNQYGKLGCKIKCPIYTRNLSSTKRQLEETKWLDATITTIDEGIISSTASHGYEGIYLKEVPLQSKAYLLGFRERDIVKEINNKPVHGLEDFIEYMKADVLKLQIYRKTVQQSLEIQL